MLITLFTLAVGPGHVMPPEKVHEKLFVGSKQVFKKPSQPAVTRYNKKHSAEQLEKTKSKLLRKEQKLRKRLAAHGIDYDFPGFVSLAKPVRNCGSFCKIAVRKSVLCKYFFPNVTLTPPPLILGIPGAREKGCCFRRCKPICL